MNKNMKRAKTSVIVLASAVVIALGGGIAYGMWADSDSMSESTIDSGDFSFTLGEATWKTDTGLEGSASDLSSSVITPGEEITIEQPIYPDFSTSNLKVAFSINLDGIPRDSGAEWHMEGRERVPSSGEAELTDSLVIPESDVANSADQMDIVVTWKVSGDGPIWTDPATYSRLPSVSFGHLTITAEQVRCGSEFSSPCEVPTMEATHD